MFYTIDMIDKIATKWVVVNDLMQKDYKYELVESMGKNFHPEFKPQLSPKQMLELGVFGGKYMRDCTDEFPASWFVKAKFAANAKDAKINFFGVNASLSLSHWRVKGWIYPDDPRGWFQWYCRYYMGRRLMVEDVRQIGRWKAIKRHVSGLTKNCTPRDLACRPGQRQALLHWAYDSRAI